MEKVSPWQKRLNFEYAALYAQRLIRPVVRACRLVGRTAVAALQFDRRLREDLNSTEGQGLVHSTLVFTHKEPLPSSLMVLCLLLRHGSGGSRPEFACSLALKYKEHNQRLLPYGMICYGFINKFSAKSTCLCAQR